MTNIYNKVERRQQLADALQTAQMKAVAVIPPIQLAACEVNTATGTYTLVEGNPDKYIVITAYSLLISPDVAPASNTDMYIQYDDYITGRTMVLDAVIGLKDVKHVDHASNSGLCVVVKPGSNVYLKVLGAAVGEFRAFVQYFEVLVY